MLPPARTPLRSPVAAVALVAVAAAGVWFGFGLVDAIEAWQGNRRGAARARGTLAYFVISTPAGADPFSGPVLVVAGAFAVWLRFAAPRSRLATAWWVVAALAVVAHLARRVASDDASQPDELVAASAWWAASAALCLLAALLAVAILVRSPPGGPGWRAFRAAPARPVAVAALALAALLLARLTADVLALQTVLALGDDPGSGVWLPDEEERRADDDAWPMGWAGWLVDAPVPVLGLVAAGTTLATVAALLTATAVGRRAGPRTVRP